MWRLRYRQALWRLVACLWLVTGDTAEPKMAHGARPPRAGDYLIAGSESGRDSNNQGTAPGESTPSVAPVPGWDGGNADAAYLDKTLLYGEIETGLDESVSRRALSWFWWPATVLSLVVFVFFLVTALFAGINFAIAGMAVSFVTFWLVLLTVRSAEPIAEWRVLLPDRALSAESAYSQISGSLRERRFPIITEVGAVATRSPLDGVRYRLVFRENSYVTYVSVFPYGTSLYLGWMMWRSRRGGQVVGQLLSDIVRSMFNRTDPELRMFRAERARAMREAVHAACREGLFVAHEQRHVPLEFGFPSGLPNPGDRRLWAWLIPTGRRLTRSVSVLVEALDLTPPQVSDAETAIAVVGGFRSNLEKDLDALLLRIGPPSAVGNERIDEPRGDQQ